LDEMAAGVTAWRGEVQSVVVQALSEGDTQMQTQMQIQKGMSGMGWARYQENGQTSMEGDRLLTSMGPRSSTADAGCEFQLEIPGRGRCRWFRCRLSSLLGSGER
jgi:hypothetical protein